jgi:peptidoglycan/xylan/chitin deacetylase (PgdA/CDA1 family)
MTRPEVRSVLLHSIAGPPNSPLESAISRAVMPYGDLSSLVGPFPTPIVSVSGPPEPITDAAAGLPTGPAQAEALAVRLRRRGFDLDWGAPTVVDDLPSLFDVFRSRGRSSVELVRADPTLLTEMQLGAFFQAYWRRRILRRAASRFDIARIGPRAAVAVLRFALDAAFWNGVRAAATGREWARFTRSSYVVLYYHRIAGEQKAGWEHLDLRPRSFHRQVQLLRLLGFRPLTPAELLDFHLEEDATLTGRRYVITADDAFRDAVEVFGRYGDLHPQVFACTASMGHEAWWTDHEPVATWDELATLQAAGGVAASHGRRHPKLSFLDDEALDDELAGALRDLDAHLPEVTPLLAYPHGDYDERVRTKTIAAGYRAAFTTQPGRNGAGTDVYCLRRVGIKDWDGPAAFLWKAMTGELLPWWWERPRQRLIAARARRRAAPAS